MTISVKIKPTCRAGQHTDHFVAVFHFDGFKFVDSGKRLHVADDFRPQSDETEEPLYSDGRAVLLVEGWRDGSDNNGNRMPDIIPIIDRFIATRQHPTPAQAQGESVTVEELADKVRRVFSMWSDKDGEDSHDYVILKQCLEWATANGYTIIKRTE